jgi:methanethiol S-methyltransferase
MRKYQAYFVCFLSLLLGGGSCLLWILFLFKGPLNLIKTSAGNIDKLLFNLFLCFIFFIQHSIMPRKWFKRRLSLFFREEFNTAIYSITSGIILLLQIFLWQGTNFLPIPVYLLYILYFLFSIATIGVLYTTFYLSIPGYFLHGRIEGTIDIFGFSPILNYSKLKEPEIISFTPIGPYRWVRHPLYFFLILLIWTSPIHSIDFIILKVTFTIWIVIGTILEERSLISMFGNTYIEYIKKAPMLIPQSIRPLL